MAILLCCRLYTKPILVLKQLRNIWEREAQESQEDDLGVIISKNENEDKIVDNSTSVPVEFLTLRRRPYRSSSRLYNMGNMAETKKKCGLSRNISAPLWKDDPRDNSPQPFSSILADLKSVTDKLAMNNFKVNKKRP